MSMVHHLEEAKQVWACQHKPAKKPEEDVLLCRVAQELFKGIVWHVVWQARGDGGIAEVPKEAAHSQREGCLGKASVKPRTSYA
jgi:hypothetical protein